MKIHYYVFKWCVVFWLVNLSKYESFEFID